MILTHQVPADPLHLHEILLILAVTGGSLTGLAVYLRYYIKDLLTRHRQEEHKD